MHDGRARRSDTWLAGVEAAAIAGPVFSIVLVAVALSSNPATTPVDLAKIGGATGFLLLSIPFGFAIAVLPCLAATQVLLRLARHDDGSLNPLAWLLLGVGLAAPLGYMVDGQDAALVMGLTGAILAMFARHRALGRAGEHG